MERVRPGLLRKDIAAADPRDSPGLASRRATLHRPKRPQHSWATKTRQIKPLGADTRRVRSSSPSPALPYVLHASPACSRVSPRRASPRPLSVARDFSRDRIRTKNGPRLRMPSSPGSTHGCGETPGGGLRYEAKASSVRLDRSRRLRSTRPRVAGHAHSTEREPVGCWSVGHGQSVPRGRGRGSRTVLPVRSAHPT